MNELDSFEPTQVVIQTSCYRELCSDLTVLHVSCLVDNELFEFRFSFLTFP